jgi:hypothetical protein
VSAGPSLEKLGGDVACPQTFGDKRGVSPTEGSRAPGRAKRMNSPLDDLEGGVKMDRNGLGGIQLRADALNWLETAGVVEIVLTLVVHHAQQSVAFVLRQHLVDPALGQGELVAAIADAAHVPHASYSLASSASRRLALVQSTKPLIASAGKTT